MLVIAITIMKFMMQECMCPISRALLRDPVIAADGHTYEREAIVPLC